MDTKPKKIAIIVEKDDVLREHYENLLLGYLQELAVEFELDQTTNYDLVKSFSTFKEADDYLRIASLSDKQGNPLDPNYPMPNLLVTVDSMDNVSERRAKLNNIPGSETANGIELIQRYRREPIGFVLSWGEEKLDRAQLQEQEVPFARSYQKGSSIRDFISAVVSAEKDAKAKAERIALKNRYTGGPSTTSTNLPPK